MPADVVLYRAGRRHAQLRCGGQAWGPGGGSRGADLGYGPAGSVRGSRSLSGRRDGRPARLAGTRTRRRGQARDCGDAPDAHGVCGQSLLVAGPRCAHGTGSLLLRPGPFRRSPVAPAVRAQACAPMLPALPAPAMALRPRCRLLLLVRPEVGPRAPGRVPLPPLRFLRPTLVVPAPEPVAGRV